MGIWWIPNNHRYIFTFKRPELPSLVRITSWHHEIMYLFIPPPIRCNNCTTPGNGVDMNLKFALDAQLLAIKLQTAMMH